jgi:predicted DNA-binding mobile mystery protein A
MTVGQLASRMGITHAAVISIEKSEARGTVNMTTLQRAAEALDCTVIYALVPNRSLDSMVRDRTTLLQIRAENASTPATGDGGKRRVAKRKTGRKPAVNARKLWRDA